MPISVGQHGIRILAKELFNSLEMRPLLQHLVASFGQRLIHRGTCNEKDMKDFKVLSCPVCRTGDRDRRPAHFISPIYRSSVPNKIHQHVGEANHGQISRGNDASLIRRRRRRHEVVELGRERRGQIQYTILLKFIFLPSTPSFPPSPSYYYPCHLRTIRLCPVPSSASRPYCGR